LVFLRGSRPENQRLRHKKTFLRPESTKSG
jgi:hypothetical protein